MIIFLFVAEEGCSYKEPRATAGYLTGGDQIVDNDILTTDLWLLGSFKHQQGTLNW